MRITSSKLAGLEPTSWRPYRGLSLLYDAPGCAAVGGVERLERLAATSDADDGLLRQLVEVSERLDTAARQAGLGLGMLPPSTYHVTLSDAVHEGVMDQVHAGRRDEVAATLSGLPDSLLWPGGVLGVLRDPGLLWRVWRDPVTYRADRLDVRGHALVVGVVPADERSRGARDRHAAARRDFAERLRSRLGIVVPEWRPHLTLGYFADEQDATRARDALLPAWQDVLRVHAGEATVTFRAAAVHGFTDLATFWRLGQ